MNIYIYRYRYTFKLYISQCFAEDPRNYICQSYCFIYELQVELVNTNLGIAYRNDV